MSNNYLNKWLYYCVTYFMHINVTRSRHIYVTFIQVNGLNGFSWDASGNPAIRDTHRACTVQCIWFTLNHNVIYTLHKNMFTQKLFFFVHSFRYRRLRLNKFYFKFNNLVLVLPQLIFYKLRTTFHTFDIRNFDKIWTVHSITMIIWSSN